MTREEKIALINSFCDWRQTIDLGDNLFTPGSEEDTYKKIEAWELKSEIFEKKSVLDIGAWDGCLSFEAEKNKASEVVALDIRKAKGFEIAHEILNSNVKHIEKDIIEAKPEDIGVFDVVLFCGVLYHMKFPFFSLHRVSNLTKLGGTLILETHAIENKSIKIENFPNNQGFYETDCYMLLYPNDELAGDPTNWVGLSVEAIASMLENVGFEVNKIILSQTPDRYTFHATKTKNEIDLKDPNMSGQYYKPMTNL